MIHKRDSLASCGSLNGFHTAIFLASEFQVDSDYYTWIPINDNNDSNKSVLSQTSRFLLESERNYFQMSRLEKDIIQKRRSQQEELKRNSLFSSISQLKRRFSTPICFNGQPNYFDLQGQLSHDINKTELDREYPSNFGSSTVKDYSMVSSSTKSLSNGCNNGTFEDSTAYSIPCSFKRYEAHHQLYASNFKGQQTFPLAANVEEIHSNINERQVEGADFINSDKGKLEKKNNRKKRNQYREGDWICKECQNINFSFRVVCNKCSYVKMS